VPEFIDPVFTKTSPKRSFSLNRKRAYWLVFAKTGSVISGKDVEENEQTNERRKYYRKYREKAESKQVRGWGGKVQPAQGVLNDL
jgi:hypothetical protein